MWICPFSSCCGHRAVQELCWTSSSGDQHLLSCRAPRLLPCPGASPWRVFAPPPWPDLPESLPEWLVAFWICNYLILTSFIPLCSAFPPWWCCIIVSPSLFSSPHPQSHKFSYLLLLFCHKSSVLQRIIAPRHGVQFPCSPKEDAQLVTL